jgi:segregation and condensation protein B
MTTRKGPARNARGKRPEAAAKKGRGKAAAAVAEAELPGSESDEVAPEAEPPAESVAEGQDEVASSAEQELEAEGEPAAALEPVAEDDTEPTEADARPLAIEPPAGEHDEEEGPTDAELREIEQEEATQGPDDDVLSLDILGDAEEGEDPAFALVGESETPVAEEAIEDTSSFLKGLVEALLFVADHPLEVKELARAAKIDRKRAGELVDEIKKDWSQRGINLHEVGGGYAFRSSPAYSDYVRSFLALRPVRLSRAQLETLAIVAYRQPITRPEIDDVRGVDCGPVLKGLLERDLVRIIGKKDEAGRPMLYGTTQAFLTMFSLNSLRDLPTLREFTELSDESRQTFESETGEAAPEGPIAFGAENAEGAPDSSAEGSAEAEVAEGEGAPVSESENPPSGDVARPASGASDAEEPRADESDESDDDEESDDDDEESDDDDEESDDDEDEDEDEDEDDEDEDDEDEDDEDDEDEDDEDDEDEEESDDDDDDDEESDEDDEESDEDDDDEDEESDEDDEESDEDDDEEESDEDDKK